MVSIIVPTYNRASLIGETLQSIKNQTYSDIEIVVVDDGSTDTTADVVGTINDSRLKYSVIPHAGRPAVPRNFGMREAKGDYIAFCDDDDVWAPDKLEKQVAVLENRGDLLLACTNVEYLPDRAVLKKMNKDEVVNLDKILYQSYIVNSSVVMRRSVIDLIGYLDEDERLKASEDYDYWCRLLAYQDSCILHLKDVLVYYRRNTVDSISSLYSGNIDDLYTRMAIVHKKVEKRFPDLIKRASENLEHFRFINNNRFKLLAGEISIGHIWKSTLFNVSEKSWTTLIWTSFVCYKITKKKLGIRWGLVEKILVKTLLFVGINIKPYLFHFRKFY
jgi:glycosyltransferase involved in cell wall biosynthesis